MKTLNDLLLEIFDSPLSLQRDRNEENKLKEKYYPHTLTNIEVHNTSHEGIPYRFMRFRHKGAWEVHFKRLDDEESGGYKRTNINKGSGASKLVATALSLYKEKLDRGHPIRYYGDDPDLQRLYNKAFKHISKKHYNSNLHSRDIPEFQSPGGKILRATEVHTKDPDGTVIDEMYGRKSRFIKLC